MAKSGLQYDYGLGFWGPNGHDGIWHIALANSLNRGSLAMPVFAGHALKNYHIGFDLLLVLLNKLTQIPIINLYFQILPIFLSIAIGAATYIFVLNWRKSQTEAFWSTFFVYFGGNFGWVITLLRDGQLGGESMFWSQQSISTLINPPFALSLLLILVGLNLLHKSLTNIAKKSAPAPRSFSEVGSTITLIILFGALIQIKAYAGALALGALFVAGTCQAIINRFQRTSSWMKKYYILITFVASTATSILLFLPLNKNSGSLLVFQPFWFLETMMQLTDRVGWLRFGEAMVNYKAIGWLFPKTILAYATSFLIFLFGNLGTRFLSLFLIFSWLISLFRHSGAKRSEAIESKAIQIFILSIITAGIILPMFFLQSGTPWNTIQFFYYSLMFLGILSGIAFASILEARPNKKYKNILIASLILLTIPTTIGTLRYVYLPSRPPAKLSTDEHEALKFLSQQEDGIVMTYPFDPGRAKEESVNPPVPLPYYVSTAYVSAFSNKPVFLEDEVNLDITGYDWKSRRKQSEDFYNSLDENYVREFIENNNIKYFYWVGGQRARLGETQLGIERIFENEEVDIYQVVENPSTQL
jgi:hypothetical protein